MAWMRDDAPRLPYTRRPAVRWFSPYILWTAGVRVALTAAVSSFVDKREQQGTFPPALYEDLAGREEVWIDYLSDTGDGFDATYTMALLVAQDSLSVEKSASLTPRSEHELEERFPGGRLLVVGGDEVYPIPGPKAYQDRFEGPFETALPGGGDVPERTMLAIPGNHDWYDGLTSFLRVFGQNKHIGGWETVQQRSYFAARLPHRWWMWGLDIQFDSYIDAPQLEFFRYVAEHHMSEGDRLIVATAVPSWLDVERDPESNRNLAYLDHKIIQPYGLRLMVTIAGNSHHYARYSDGETLRLTSGGGGAFLHPTHTLPKCIEQPPRTRYEQAVGDEQRPPLELAAARCYPPRTTSRALALLAVLLPWRNLSFVPIPGLIVVVLLWSNHFGNRLITRSAAPADVLAQDMRWHEYVAATFRTPTSLVTVAILLGAFVALAQAPPWAGRGRPKMVMKLVMGATHFAAQYLVMMVTTMVVLDLVASFADGRWFVVWVTLAALAIGGVAASFVLGLYLAFWNAVPGLRTHGNAAFAASRLSRHKSFLRMHLNATGTLTIHAIGVRRICRKWRPALAGERPCPVMMPAKEFPRAHLIESIEVDPDTPRPAS